MLFARITSSYRSAIDKEEKSPLQSSVTRSNGELFVGTTVYSEVVVTRSSKRIAFDSVCVSPTGHTVSVRNSTW